MGFHFTKVLLFTGPYWGFFFGLIFLFHILYLSLLLGCLLGNRQDLADLVAKVARILLADQVIHFSL